MENVLLRVDRILFTCSLASGPTLMHVYQWNMGGWTCFIVEKDRPKNQPHQITLDVDIAS